LVIFIPRTLDVYKIGLPWVATGCDRTAAGCDFADCRGLRRVPAGYGRFQLPAVGHSGQRRDAAGCGGLRWALTGCDGDRVAAGGRTAAFCCVLWRATVCCGVAAPFGCRRRCSVKFGAHWLLFCGLCCFARCKFFLGR
jgi:hypothetical protein